MSKLILMQYDESIASRTFLHFNNDAEMIKRLFQLAKEQSDIKGVLNSASPTNDLERVTVFVLSLYDFGYYENVTQRYVPYGKTWFINKLTEALESIKCA